MPQVTIITPVFQASRFLRRTIFSVQEQTMIDWELLLIIDAHSTDESESIACEMAEQDRRIRVLRGNHHLGASRNRNAGIQASRGRYLAFLDSDDLWYPTKLEKQLAFIAERKAALVFHSYQPVIDGRPVGRARISPEEVRWMDLLKDNQIGNSTVMIDYKQLPSFQYQDGDHEDFQTWLKFLKNGGVAYGMPEVLSAYTLHPNSRSANKTSSARKRIRLIFQQDINLYSKLNATVQYALRSLLRRLPYKNKT